MSSEMLLYARAFLALLFVAGLIFLCAALAKKYGLDKRVGGVTRGQRQLVILETLYIDPKHKLVIVRRGEREHLLLLGASGVLLIETHPKERV